MPDSSDSSASDTAADAPGSRASAWAQLVRLPNVLTVIADVGAAFMLVSHGPFPLSRFVCVVSAGVCLYWAGMVLNDVFDVDKDRSERPTRPIPAGDVSLAAASRVGWGLMVAGCFLAAISGRLPASGSPVTWLPLVVAITLSVTIVAYDGPLKRTPIAPPAMGGCRVLSFLLGASPALAANWGENPFPPHLIAIAIGFGVYITGITTMARKEAVGGRTPNLILGWATMVSGIIILGLAPRLAENRFGWHISPDDAFPIMIGLIALPVVVRGYRAIVEPTPRHIQTSIRVGILSIIPLAATFATLGAGVVWGLAILALAAPSMLLARLFRVT